MNTPYQSPPKPPFYKNRRVLLAAAAIGTVLVARATGLDGGLIDEFFQAIAESLSEPGHGTQPVEPPR